MTNAREPAVGDDGVGDLEAAGEGVHAADVGVKQVDGLEALAADLGVEVDAAGGETAHVQDAEHALRRQIDARRELVGIPAQQVIAGVGVDRAQCPGSDGDLQLVHHLVTGQGRVIGLEVELEVRQEVVGPQEIQAGGGIGIVLVLGRLLGLGLDVERAAEADLLLVIDGHVEEPAEVVELALHVGVEQGRVAFAATPERVAGPAQLVGDLHRLLDLGPGEGEDVEVRAGGRAVHEPGIGEEVGRSPEQLDAGPGLLVLEDLDDLVEIGVALLEVVALGGDVAIVKRVERRARASRRARRRPWPAAGRWRPSCCRRPRDGTPCRRRTGRRGYYRTCASRRPRSGGAPSSFSRR